MPFDFRMDELVFSFFLTVIHLATGLFEIFYGVLGAFANALKAVDKSFGTMIEIGIFKDVLEFVHENVETFIVINVTLLTAYKWWSDHVNGALGHKKSSHE